MARPNCLRVLAYAVAASSAAWASPVAAAAMPEPAAVEGGQGDAHALPLGADATVGLDADPVVVHLADRVAVQAHRALGRAEAEAGRVARHDETGQPARPVVGRARERRVEVGVAGVGDPRLRALQQVCRAVRDRAGAHRADVRTGTRLGQGVGAQLVAAEHLAAAGSPAARGCQGGQRETGEGVHARADGDAHPRGRDLLDDLQVDLVGLGGAAELLRVGQRQQAGLPQQPVAPRGETPAAARSRRRSAPGSGADVAGQVDQVAGVVGRQQAVNGHVAAQASDAW